MQYPWHRKVHPSSYRQRLERAHLRLAVAMKELELVMDFAPEDASPEELAESELYMESAAELRGNA
jgi:hypothetical protein